MRPEAFPSEVDTGSRKENASKQESKAPFRFHRNEALDCQDFTAPAVSPPTM